MDKKIIWIGGAIILVFAFLAWLFYASTRPLPGQKQEDLGRGHEPIGTEVKYNSNPPTSGPHYEEWTRAGVYSEPKDDRNLVHSLEHGYIIMHYRCRVESKESTESAESLDSSPSAQNDNIVDIQPDCDNRKSQLEEVYNNKGKRKLIVVARPNLDTSFALTAWDYLDKFEQFDKERIEKFIDTHLDNGPERTME